MGCFHHHHHQWLFSWSRGGVLDNDTPCFLNLSLIKMTRVRPWVPDKNVAEVRFVAHKDTNTAVVFAQVIDYRREATTLAHTATFRSRTRAGVPQKPAQSKSSAAPCFVGHMLLTSQRKRQTEPLGKGACPEDRNHPALPSESLLPAALV